jgi:hypothetical protein
MRLLRVLAFSVSVVGLIATHKADADVHCLRGTRAVEDGRDLHHCEPVAWICRSQGANRHWGEGWSDNRETASRRALAACTSHGGQACSNPKCSHPPDAPASTTTGSKTSQPKQRLQPCSFDWGGCPMFRQTGPNGQGPGLQYTTINTPYFHRPGSKFFPKGPGQQSIRGISEEASSAKSSAPSR